MIRLNTAVFLGLILFLNLSSLTAFASSHDDGPAFFDLTFFPQLSTKTDTDSGATSPGVAAETGIGYDARTNFGYVFDNGILLGFSYDYYTFTSTRKPVLDGNEGLDETTKRSEYGPTIGYLNNGWRALFTYFLAGSQEKETINKNADGTVSGNVAITQDKMTGYQITLGYTFAFGRHFEIGPSVVYRSVTYTTQEKANRLRAEETYGSTELFNAKVDDSLTPMLSMQLRF